jgi:BolA protein
MNNRIQIITERLQNAFSPTHLEVIDDSHKHVGHAGAEGGAGHYKVIIQADIFKGKSRVDIHREIYRVLNDMIPHEIHALQILSS